jgi:hypothetical protein
VIAVHRRGQEGVVLISVILAGAVLSLVIVGLLDAVSDDLRLIRYHKDYLRARYVADAGVAMMLGFIAEKRMDQIPAGRAIAVGDGSVTVHRISDDPERANFLSTGRVGRGIVTVRLAVDLKLPHRVRVWTEEP